MSPSLFFVWLRWRQTRSLTCYCAGAETREEAIGAAVRSPDRLRDIVEAQAEAWPTEPELAPPRLSNNFRGCFALTGAKYRERLLLHFKVLASPTFHVDPIGLETIRSPGDRPYIRKCKP